MAVGEGECTELPLPPLAATRRCSRHAPPLAAAAASSAGRQAGGRQQPAVASSQQPAGPVLEPVTALTVHMHEISAWIVQALWHRLSVGRRRRAVHWEVVG